MKLTDKDLEVFSKHIGKVPFINMTKENTEILKSIVDELIEKRKIQKGLIKLLEEADEMYDKLQWELMMKNLPEMIKHIIDKKKKAGD